MVRNLIRTVVSLFLTSVTVFLLLRVLPGDPAQVRLGIHATPEALAQLRAELGTDQPLLVQYQQWISGLFNGDLGDSLISGNPLTPIIADRISVSVILVIYAVAIALSVAIVLGTLSALYPNTRFGQTIAAISRIGVSMPGFIVALGLVTLFALNLKWLPASGWTVPAVDFGDFSRRIILPSMALASVPTAVLIRHIRAAMLDIGDADFVRAAMASGKTRARAFIRHGLPNAFVTISTITALVFVDLIVGAVVIEQVFDIPGIGTFLIKAVGNRDVFAVQSAIICVAAIIVVTNMVVDTVAQYFDTRLMDSGDRTV